jgi:CHAT domain-containing protein/Tfp pilus assembly protein PilF
MPVCTGRAVAAAAAVAIAALFLIAPGPERAAGQEAASDSAASPAEADAAAALRERIATLRGETRLDEAVRAAQELVAVVEADTARADQERADASRLLATVQHVASLPPVAQRALARADSLIGVLEACVDRKDAAGGAAVLDTIVAVEQRWLGERHIEVATTLLLGAQLKIACGQWHEAEPLLREACAIRRESLGDRHPELASALNWLAYLLQDLDRYEEAAEMQRDVLAIYRATPGLSRARLHSALTNYASTLYFLGRYDEAEARFREDLAIAREEFGPWQPQTAVVLRNLGRTQQRLGRFADAEQAYREAVAILRESGDETSPGFVSNLAALGSLHRARGEYGAAEPLLRRALEIDRASSAVPTARTATLFGNLADLRVLQGDLATAEELFTEALAIQRRLRPEGSLAAATTIDNLATVHRRRHDLAGAESLYREALDMRRAAVGEEDRLVAFSLNNLGLLLRERGDLEAAEPLLRRSLEIRRAVEGEGHPSVARALSSLGLLEIDRGRLDEAEALFEGALAIRRRTLAHENPLTGMALKHLASIRLARGDPAGAEVQLGEAARIYDVARTRVGTGIDRATAEIEDPYPLLGLTLLERGRFEEAWPVVETARARVLGELLAASRSKRFTPEEASREEAMRRELARLESALTASLADTARGAIQGRLLAAEADWAEFQRELAERHPDLKVRTAELEEVQAALDDQTAIVGWCDGELWPGALRRWGYVVRSSGQVRWVPLPVPATAKSPGAPPDTTARELRRLLMRPFSDPGRLAALGARLGADRFTPLEEALAGVQRLVIIPSGDLLGLPLEILVDAQGRYLADRFLISYTPSATVHARLTSRTGRDTGRPLRALLVGDPVFQPDHVAGMDTLADARRSATPGADRTDLANLPRLAHTRREVEGIAAACPGSRLLLGTEASEQTLATMAAGGDLARFDVIHLATHAMVDELRPFRSALVLSQVGLPDPFEAALGGEAAFDGLLTSAEILAGWRLDADLVVLSACETALGREVAGEGTIGFAYTFLQVGARALLVSLWPVEDRATALLMRRFYENLSGAYRDERDGQTAQPLPAAQALREAKRFLRGGGGGAGGSVRSHPFYWSAFILVGPD